MDGDIADISGILELINKYDNIYLIVDEAHATGIFGQDGKGFTYKMGYEKLITLHTCGKALGVSGGLVCAQKYIIDYLINKIKTVYIYYGRIPAIAIAVKEA